MACRRTLYGDANQVNSADLRPLLLTLKTRLGNLASAVRRQLYCSGCGALATCDRFHDANDAPIAHVPGRDALIRRLDALGRFQGFRLPPAGRPGYIGDMSTASLAQPKQHVSTTPGICGGKPCITGTRIRVWDVAALDQSGHSPDEILTHYPSLTLADVHAALAYYYDNREEIERTAAEDDRFAEDLRRKLGAGPLEQSLAEEAGPPRP